MHSAWENKVIISLQLELFYLYVILRVIIYDWPLNIKHEFYRFTTGPDRPVVDQASNQTQIFMNFIWISGHS